MSLNKEQRRITAEELQAHFEESTLSVQMIAEMSLQKMWKKY